MFQRNKIDTAPLDGDKYDNLAAAILNQAAIDSAGGDMEALCFWSSEWCEYLLDLLDATTTTRRRITCAVRELFG